MLHAPISLAIVMTAFHPGGTEHQMLELIRRLDPTRFRVHIACFHRTGAWLARAEAAAVEVREFPLRSFKSPHTLLVARDFIAWLKQRQIDVVHACDRYANIFGLPGAAVAGVRLRLASRRELAPPDQMRAHRVAMGLAYRAAHRVVANSTAAAEMLAAEGVDRRKVVVIPNGIDVARFPAASPATTRRVIATVANLRPGKGHDVLLQAFARVLADIPDARLRLVGDGALRPQLEAMAALHGMTHAVEFLGHREDVPQILASSDVYAFPSWSEAFPNGLLEGMAAGLPTVTTRVGGMLELTHHGTNGLLVRPGDVGELTAALLELMRNRPLADTLGAAARSTIEERYSFARMVREFSDLYAAAAEDSHSRCVA